MKTQHLLLSAKVLILATLTLGLMSCSNDFYPEEIEPCSKCLAVTKDLSKTDSALRKLARQITWNPGKKTGELTIPTNDILPRNLKGKNISFVRYKSLYLTVVLTHSPSKRNYPWTLFFGEDGYVRVFQGDPIYPTIDPDEETYLLNNTIVRFTDDLVGFGGYALIYSYTGEIYSEPEEEFMGRYKRQQLKKGKVGKGTYLYKIDMK